MTTNYQLRYAAHPADARNYDTARLRQDFLIESLFVADEVQMVYSMYDRMIVGGAMPVNENLPLEKIREYVWYMETRGAGNVASVNSNGANGADTYLLGVADGAAYYFCYERGATVKLNRALLRKLKTKAERYVVYADICLLDDSELEKYNIAFKKIPRDIAQL